MTEYKLSQINIFPVKSLPGISVSESQVEERGLKLDRRWMLVDKDNSFITQRLYPELIFIDVQIERDFLIFTHRRDSLEPLKISLNKFPDKSTGVVVWEDICIAREYGNEVNDWFSEALRFNCKLVYMPNSTNRKTSTKYFKESKDVSFADGYPFLIIGEESLNYLNNKLKYPVVMDQFRPNLVFTGGNFHDEDTWKLIKIGNIKFAVVKPCARCVITTIDLSSGSKNKEPLATLSTYRNFNNKVMFGQNALALDEGRITIGDRILVE